MRIRFVRAVVVDDFRKGTADEERYEAGQVVDLPEPSARRWIGRNAAVEVAEAVQTASVQQPAEVVAKAAPKATPRAFTRPKTQA
jgi:hypothetical protein